MSEKWEVVGKKKSKDIATTIKKPDIKKVSNTPRVEEVLPLQQVKSLYSTGKNKENRKPQEKVKMQENGSKKQPKKVDKSQDPVKPKPYKSIESALNGINVEECKTIYENSKQLFPDGPLIWLKEVSLFLNQRLIIDVQDYTFSSKPKSYPLSIVPTQLKNIIERSIREVGKNNAQLFFDLSLISMANDMSKNLSVLGYKIYIQYLALNYPHLAVTNLNKHIILRNSYQNRQQIGLSIMWCLGQAGNKDLNIGLKVFQEIMLPLIEMKSYSRYVVQYMIDLINHHDKANISSDYYLLVLDVAYANFKNFPNDLRKSMQSISLKLNSMLFTQSSNEKCHALVEPLLIKVQSNSNNSYKDGICEVLAECFIKNPTAFGSWSKCYTKYLLQSAVLLNYLDQNWTTIAGKLNRTALKDLLKIYDTTNEELFCKKKKEPGLLDSMDAIRRLTEKMKSQKKSGFPYKFFSFFLIAIIAGVVYYDVRQYGHWNKCRTYSALKESGVLEYSGKALDRSQQGFRWLHLQIDEQFPGYFEKSADLIRPYSRLARELGLLFYNMYENAREVVIEKYPGFIDSVESYAPGLLEQSQKTMNNVWTTSVLYFNRSVRYLKTEVFVGQLAPENMQRVVLEAINTTQQKATECYHWLYEKVQSTMK